MTKELARKLVNLLTDLGVENTVLIGGEPTLYEYFFTIIKYIKEKGMRATVVTNALRFSQHKFVEKTARTGLDDVTTSIKGSSRVEYEQSTGYAGGYDLVRQAIKNLQRTSIRQKVSITVSRSIIENWDTMIRLIKDCEAILFSISFEKPCILPEKKVVFDDKMLSKELASFIEEVMYPSLLETGKDFRLEFMCPQCYFSEDFINRVEKDKHAFGGCLLLRTKGLVFDPDGFVLPCNHFAGYPLGQYGKDFQTASEFIEWDQQDLIRSFYENIKLAPCKKCSQCDRWHKCGAGCRLFWFYRGPEQLPVNSR